MSVPSDEHEHTPVLPQETLAALAVTPGGRYIDATFGRGGHSRLILDALGADGVLVVIDRDPAAIAAAERLFGGDSRVRIEHGPFSDVAMIAAKHGLDGRLDGLLLDFGVSSPQLDDPARGFSFRSDGPLDMRMDTSRGETCAEYLAVVAERELAGVLASYGEERYARRIARAVVAARAERALTRTAQLAEIIRQSVPPARDGIDPATRSFQALRIVVNRELDEIDAVLASAVPLLNGGGRLVAISFHSLEDRRVKRFMRAAASVAAPYRGLPDVPADYQPTLRLVGRLIRATPDEVQRNPRSRSARLRVAERRVA